MYAILVLFPNLVSIDAQVDLGSTKKLMIKDSYYTIIYYFIAILINEKKSFCCDARLGLSLKVIEQK